MLKVSVFKDNEEQKPYYILLNDQQYDEFKDESPEVISAHFYIGHVFECEDGRLRYERVSKVEKEKHLNIPNYVVVKWRFGTSLMSVYIPEDYYDGSTK